MTTVGLLAIAVLLLALAPAMAGARWTRAAPRLAICVWQAAAFGVTTALVLAGFTLLVPATALSAGLAEVLHACASTIAGVYGSPGQLPGVLFGALLAVALPLRLAAVALRTGWRERRKRHDLRAAVALAAHADPSLGLLVLESERPAAFCIPGRGRVVVLTSAAVRTLTEPELAGVLAHERAHLRARHHLALAGPRLLNRAFPGVPLFATASAETERLVELLADDAAARSVQRIDVASALVTLAGMTAPSAALAAASGSDAALRVTRLLEPRQSLHPVHRLLMASAAVAAVAGPLVLAAWPLLSAIWSGLCLMPMEAGSA